MDGYSLQKKYNEESNHLSLFKLERLPEEIELSPLVSNLNSSLMELFEDEVNIQNKYSLTDLIKTVTECLKHEYRKTKDLQPKEFYVWHISMFMTIQTYITIIESKYCLNDIEETKNLFSSLLKKEFLSFLENNEKRMNINCVEYEIPKIKIPLNHTFEQDDNTQSYLYVNENNMELIELRIKPTYSIKNINNMENQGVGDSSW